MSTQKHIFALTDELASRVEIYRAARGHDSTEEAVRELLTLGIDMALRAYKEVPAWAAKLPPPGPETGAFTNKVNHAGGPWPIPTS